MSLTGARRFAKVHRQPRAIRNRNPFPLHRLPRTAGRTTPGTCAGAPAEPARTSFITASRSLLRPAVRSIATAAPPRVPRRCRFPHRSYRRFGRLYRPGRPWVPHRTQQAAGCARRAQTVPFHAHSTTQGVRRMPDRAGCSGDARSLRIPVRARLRKAARVLHRHTAVCSEMIDSVTMCYGENAIWEPPLGPHRARQDRLSGRDRGPPSAPTQSEPSQWKPDSEYKTTGCSSAR